MGNSIPAEIDDAYDLDYNLERLLLLPPVAYAFSFWDQDPGLAGMAIIVCIVLFVVYVSAIVARLARKNALPYGRWVAGCVTLGAAPLLALYAVGVLDYDDPLHAQWSAPFVYFGGIAGLLVGRRPGLPGWPARLRTTVVIAGLGICALVALPMLWIVGFSLLLFATSTDVSIWGRSVWIMLGLSGLFFFASALAGLLAFGRALDEAPAPPPPTAA